MNSLKILNRLMRQEQYMLNQFCSNLQTMIARLTAQQKGSTEALTSLEQYLNGELSWANANKVELALIDYYDEVMLLTEWQRRLAEINRLPKHLRDFYNEHAAEIDTSKLRSLLVRLVSDLQWFRESRRVIRYNESQMRRKIAGLFLFSFVLFFTPTLFRALFSFEFDNLRLYYIFTAATSGILGATFSQLTSIQSRVQSANLDQVRAMSQLGYIVARTMVGAGAGLIMFYLLQSGLLSGAFFPEFIHNVNDLDKFQTASVANVTDKVQALSQQIETKLAIGTLARPAQGLSLLIVWCLLAGFSEKLIPGILNNKSKNLQESTNKNHE